MELDHLKILILGTKMSKEAKKYGQKDVLSPMRDTFQSCKRKSSQKFNQQTNLYYGA